MEIKVIILNIADSAFYINVGLSTRMADQAHQAEEGLTCVAIIHYSNVTIIQLLPPDIIILSYLSPFPSPTPSFSLFLMMSLGFWTSAYVSPTAAIGRSWEYRETSNILTMWEISKPLLRKENAYCSIQYIAPEGWFATVS